MAADTISAPAQQLYDNDPSASALGIELLRADDDGATVRMVVTDEMANGFRIGHGGITFLLADSAMAFGSNAHGGVSLATSSSIDWLAPVEIGDTLIADCRLAHGGGKSKIWSISVTNQNEVQVAAITGRTRRVRDADPS